MDAGSSWLVGVAHVAACGTVTLALGREWGDAGTLLLLFALVTEVPLAILIVARGLHVADTPVSSRWSAARVAALGFVGGLLVALSVLAATGGRGVALASLMGVQVLLPRLLGLGILVARSGRKAAGRTN